VPPVSVGWRPLASSVLPRHLSNALPSRPVLLAFVASRALVLATAVAAEAWVGRNPRLTSGSDAPLLRSLTAWDGWWYLGIARDGYSAAPLAGQGPNLAFWPLYPILVRLVSLPWPSLDSLLAVLLSNLAFLLALGLVERLGANVLADARATRGAVLLAISPFGFAFSMAYPESLFLLLAVAGCLAAERGRWALAGISTSLATLARLAGLALLPTLLWIGLNRWRSDWRWIAWLGLVPAAALVFFAFTALLAGRPDAYLAAEAAWGRGGVASDPGSLASHLDWIRASQLATFLAAIYLLVFARVDGLPGRYLAWPIVALALEFASGNLVSVGRHLTVVVPFFWLLAGRRSRLGRTWPLVSASLLVLASFVVFAGQYVP
jgi:hypothetical protein